jgi:hypothetical protein
MQNGSVMIELTVGVFIFAASTLGCAFIISMSYSCYQDGIRYCQAVTLLQRYLNCPLADLSQTPATPFTLQMSRQRARATQTNAHFLTTRSPLVTIVTISWQGRSASYSVSGVRSDSA